MFVLKKYKKISAVFQRIEKTSVNSTPLFYFVLDLALCGLRTADGR